MHPQCLKTCETLQSIIVHNDQTEPKAISIRNRRFTIPEDDEKDVKLRLEVEVREVHFIELTIRKT